MEIIECIYNSFVQCLLYRYGRKYCKSKIEENGFSHEQIIECSKGINMKDKNCKCNKYKTK